jgi:arylsulfatase A-like enzyme
MKKKNIILLIIDSLNYNRLGFADYHPSPSPTIDRLLSSGLTFTNCFTTGCPTQFSIPTIFTSTLPLDKGGYAEGVNNRDVGLTEIFKKEGYKTASFYTDVNWLDYQRGFDDCFLLFSLRRFFDWVYGYSLDYYGKLYRSKNKSVEEILIALEPFLTKVFKSIKLFCRENEKRMKEKIFPSNFHKYEYSKIEPLAISEEQRFSSNPKNYILNLLSSDKKKNFFYLLRSIDESVTKGRFKNTDKHLQGLLIKTFLDILFLSLKNKPNLKVIREYLYRFLHKQGGSVKGFSGAFVIDTFLNWINNLNNDSFFAWIHLNDIHDLNFVSYDIDDKAFLIKEEVSTLKEFYREIRNKKNNYLGNPLYDFSIKYVDGQVARLIAFLKERGILDNTLIILTSDHGNSTAAWPMRGKVNTAADFYDELYRIPLAFINKEIESKKIDSLCSSLDIAPTIFDLMKLSIPSSFQGESLIKPNWLGREFVVMEHLGPGPCDFTSKPINVCLRSKTHKLIYQEFPSNTSEREFIKEAYDLIKDPFEKNNIKNKINYSKDLQWLLSIAKERVSQIKKELIP